MPKVLSKILISATAILLALVNIMPALADGGLFPPPDYYVYETGQEAAIFFDQGREVLILTTTFKGGVKDFGWVIPVPSKPEVSKGSDEVLENLREIVAERYRYVGIAESPILGGYEQYKETVTVIETKKIDYLELSVLTATDSEALAQWLKDNGYQYPQESTWILNDYIQNQWFFIAVKVSPEAENASDVVQGLVEGHVVPLKIEFDAKTPVYPLRISGIETSGYFVQLSDDLILGNAEIKELKRIGYDDLADKTKGPAIFDQVVRDLMNQVLYNDSTAKNYPLIFTQRDYEYALYDISIRNKSDMKSYYVVGVSGWFRAYFSQQGIRGYWYRHNVEIPINLYVIADYKVQASNFEIKYGNWIKKDTVDNLGSDFNGQPIFNSSEDKYFLTHLFARMTPSDMIRLETDVYLKKTENNDLVNAIELKGTIMRFWITVSIALAVLIGCVIVLIIWLKKPPEK